MCRENRGGDTFVRMAKSAKIKSECNPLPGIFFLRASIQTDSSDGGSGCWHCTCTTQSITRWQTQQDKVALKSTERLLSSTLSSLHLCLLCYYHIAGNVTLASNLRWNQDRFSNNSRADRTISTGVWIKIKTTQGVAVWRQQWSLNWVECRKKRKGAANIPTIKLVPQLLYPRRPL